MSKLTAWERWELANFDADTPVAANGAGSNGEPVTVDVQELARLREEARKEGHAAGYASGLTAVQTEARHLGNAAANLEQALNEYDQQVADELLALAMEIARQVIRTEIAVRPDVIVNVVHEALAQLPHQHVTIFLHPDDLSLVRQHAGELLTHAGHRLLEDPRLKRGDCVLESGSSQTDATLATRWRRVVETLGLSSAWEVQDKE